MRRRRKENPTRTEWIMIAGGAAATLAGIFWNVRASGMILGGTAVYSALEGHPRRGAILGALGGLVFFSPEIQTALGMNGGNQTGIGALPTKSLLTSGELAEFKKSFERVIEILDRFQKRLSPHDTEVLQIGMRASHIEEAMAHGDMERANAHLRALVGMVEKMSTATATAA